MQANTRKILAATLSDPLEESRMLFERQVEETELEGRLKQRRRLLDLTSEGKHVQQVRAGSRPIPPDRAPLANLTL